MSSSWVLAIVTALGLVTIGHCGCPGRAELPDIVAEAGRGSKCYALVVNPLRFHQAENSCHKTGGHLASIHSEESNAVLVDLMNQTAHYQGNSWIGLTDAHKNQRLTWMDNTDVDYFNWANGHDDDTLHKTSVCVSLNSRDEKWYKWNCNSPDVHFDEVKAYICEYND